MINWSAFTEQLRDFPVKSKLAPPCSLKRVREVEANLGPMPADLAAMLADFNGGRLFLDYGPMMTLFGLWLPTDDPELDWFIDRFTPAWRAEVGKPTDWVIGMMNYGGLHILSGGFVEEWDTSRHKWLIGRYSYQDWLDKIFADAEETREELESDDNR